MVRFSGYVKKDEPKWFYLLVFFGGAFLLLSLLSVISFFSRPVDPLSTLASSTISTTTVAATTTTLAAATAATTITINHHTSSQTGEGLKVEKLLFTSALSADNQPVEDILEISSAANRLYCFMTVSSSQLPQELRHVWLGPAGEVWAEIPLNIKHSPVNTWSYVSLAGKRAGEWQLQVKDASGKTLASKKIIVRD